MKHLFSIATATALILTASSVYAKSINMYTEPKLDSKVAGSIDPAAGVTIVYTPKDGEWIKVANPANGDVGWIKSADLGVDHYYVRVSASRNGSALYNSSQLSRKPQQFTQQQIDKEMRQFELQQQMMHQQMQQLMTEMYNPFYFPQPVFVPVVIMPQQKKSVAAETIKTTPTSDKIQAGKKQEVNKPT